MARNDHQRESVSTLSLGKRGDPTLVGVKSVTDSGSWRGRGGAGLRSNWIHFGTSPCFVILLRACAHLSLASGAHWGGPQAAAAAVGPVGHLA